MSARMFKDPVHGILIGTHNPGGGTEAVAFGQTPHHSLDHLLFQVETEEHGVATLGESALTGSAPQQLCSVFSVDVIADNVALSLLCVILAFLVGTETLRYFHDYPFVYVRLFKISIYLNRKEIAR